jgi:hypothetical protein
VLAQWRADGDPEDDIEFFLEMRTNPPEAGPTPLPTVEEVSGRPGRTFLQWATEHTAQFHGP